jgi:hypothetical protein
LLSSRSENPHTAQAYLYANNTLFRNPATARPACGNGRRSPSPTAVRISVCNDDGKCVVNNRCVAVARSTSSVRRSCWNLAGIRPSALAEVKAAVVGSLFWERRLRGPWYSTSHSPSVCNHQNGYSGCCEARGAPKACNNSMSSRLQSANGTSVSPWATRPNANNSNRGLCGARMPARFHVDIPSTSSRKALPSADACSPILRHFRCLIAVGHAGLIPPLTVRFKELSQSP